jgi:hypothetical protein
MHTDQFHQISKVVMLSLEYDEKLARLDQFWTLRYNGDQKYTGNAISLGYVSVLTIFTSDSVCSYRRKSIYMYMLSLLQLH